MQLSLFDETNRKKKLMQMGDVLQQINEVVDWNAFRGVLDTVFPKKDKPKGGRPPFDSLLMFKILIIKRLYNLSLDQTEFQINDRISFMRFLGLGLENTVPDAKTIWNYENALANNEAGRQLFDLFFAQLLHKGYITRAGSIVDASFIEAPKRKNTKEQREALKRGDIPEEWNDPEHPQKLSQRDTDATWTVKNREAHFGYKDTVKVDLDSKLITDYAVTSAEVHDSNEFENFLNEKDQVVYADSAYVGKTIPQGVENCVNEKGYKGKPLTEAQKESNRQKSKTRARIEHVFGFITGSMHGLTLRSIGINRARFNIGLTNLVYNMCRYSILKRKGPLTTG